MALDLDKFQRLKKKSEDAKTAYDKAVGTLEEKMKTLKENFGVETLDAAKKLLEEMQDEYKEPEQQYDNKLAAFEEKWGETI